MCGIINLDVIVMKKIVWVFGESATGKLTLINNLCNNDKDTLDTFNMNNKKICVSEITLEDRDHENYVDVKNIDDFDDTLLENDSLYFNKQKELKRRSCIMYDVDNFIKSDNDILLIKGQTNDMNIRRGNIVGNFLNKYYGLDNLKIEVFVLQVTDEYELKKRLETKTWFKEMDDLIEKERLIKTIPLKQQKHKEEVINSFDNYDIPIYQIESLDGLYRLDGVINGKSSSTRR